MQLIDGKKTSQEIKVEIAQEVQKMMLQAKKTTLGCYLGRPNDGGSETYVAARLNRVKRRGDPHLVRFDGDVTEEELLSVVKS